MDWQEFCLVRTSIAGHILQGCVGRAAIFADVFLGFFTLEEDMLAFSTENVRAIVSLESLGIWILHAAVFAVNGGGFWRRSSGVRTRLVT